MWLIQRDFLEGQSITSMVDAALKQLRIGRNPSLTQLNAIRKELTSAHTTQRLWFGAATLTANKTMRFGRIEIDPKYVQQRDELRKQLNWRHKLSTIS